MDKAIIGKKLGMSQIFTADGKVIPSPSSRRVPAPWCRSRPRKTTDTKPCKSVSAPSRKPESTSPLPATSRKPASPSSVICAELRLANCAAYELGQELTCDVFAEGDKVDVTGTSKGHGYSGVIQRWNSHRIGPMSHGTGPIHRSVGSMGACSSPSRVFKNKHMAGQWGTREGDGAEPHRRARRQGEKSAAHQGRGSRTEGRRCRRQGFREGLSGGRR